MVTPCSHGRHGRAAARRSTSQRATAPRSRGGRASCVPTRTRSATRRPSSRPMDWPSWRGRRSRAAGAESVAIATAAGGGVPGAVRRFVVGEELRRLPAPGRPALPGRFCWPSATPGRTRRRGCGSRYAPPRRTASRRRAPWVAARRASSSRPRARARSWRGRRRRVSGSANRTLYALRLDAHGHARGGPVVISRTALATVRLAGSPDGRSIVSWLKPGRSPQGRPSRSSPACSNRRSSRSDCWRPHQGRVVGRPAAVALGASGQTLAAATAIGGEPTDGAGVFAARSAFGGGTWRGYAQMGARRAIGVSRLSPIKPLTAIPVRCSWSAARAW